MSENKLHKFVLYIISLYTGLIVTDCAQRVMLSLARHGLMSWREYIYDTKIILLVAVYITYQHLKPALLLRADEDFYKHLLHKNLPFFAIIVIATRLVFTQFPTFYEVYISPLKILFFVW